jgi:type IV pilus assembly protein PilV
MMNMIHRQRTARRSTRGAALLEALVAVLIFVIGVLGIVGLQVSMTRAQSASKFRADAAALTNELIGVLWVDQPNMAKYTTANCDTHARCLDWKNKVASHLPGGTVETLSADVATGAVVVKVTWTVPNEGSHSYESSTNVQ